VLVRLIISGQTATLDDAVARALIARGAAVPLPEERETAVQPPQEQR
jgi:hypothetical protein